jgi:hypothetical protein
MQNPVPVDRHKEHHNEIGERVLNKVIVIPAFFAGICEADMVQYDQYREGKPEIIKIEHPLEFFRIRTDIGL